MVVEEDQQRQSESRHVQHRRFRVLVSKAPEEVEEARAGEETSTVFVLLPVNPTPEPLDP